MWEVGDRLFRKSQRGGPGNSLFKCLTAAMIPTQTFFRMPLGPEKPGLLGWGAEALKPSRVRKGLDQQCRGSKWVSTQNTEADWDHHTTPRGPI